MAYRTDEKVAASTKIRNLEDKEKDTASTKIDDVDDNDTDTAKPKYFHSRRIKKGDIRKPWLAQPPDPAEKWLTIMPFTGAFLGLCIAGVLIWDGWVSVHTHKYCLMFEDTFQDGLNPDIWTPEITTGGFG